ncbi:MAG TPA: DUF2442 domain-containing protein, partial [Thermoanaerobaculia bacterium]|nr:DUF2442 domain-containing protein [Thermoanaerobaculia bacterium]
DATITQLSKVERPFPHHLYWPELDVDLHLESIGRPEAYPLVSAAARARSDQAPPVNTDALSAIQESLSELAKVRAIPDQAMPGKKDIASDEVPRSGDGTDEGAVDRA